MRPIKNKTSIIAASTGLIILVLILAFVVPLLVDISNNSKNLLSEKNEVAILKAQSDQIDQFKTIYDGYKPNLEKMSQLLIDPKNPVDFIKFLEDAAANSGIQVLTSIIPTPKDKTIVSLQLSSTDDFLKILHFSKELENGSYLVDVQNVLIKNADTDASIKSQTSGKVNATFSINVLAKP